MGEGGARWKWTKLSKCMNVCFDCLSPVILDTSNSYIYRNGR